MARTKASIARFRIFDDVWLRIEEVGYTVVIVVPATDKVEAHDKPEGYFQHFTAALECVKKMWVCRGKAGKIEGQLDDLIEIVKASDEFLVTLCASVSQGVGDLKDSLKAERECTTTPTS